MTAKQSPAQRRAAGDSDVNGPNLGRLALRLFDELFPAASWRAWRAFLVALFGLRSERGAESVIREATGRSKLPTTTAREAWIIAGRRSGKSRVADAFLAVVFACLKPHQLAPGERGVVLIIAADRRQGRVVFGYTLALLQQLPVLARMIARTTQTTIALTNGISIEIATASFRTTRGYTIVAAICDEIAFWPTENAAEPDADILNALRPAMATTGGMLIATSTPYAPVGELHRAHERYFGRNDSDVLVWQAPTRLMNPTINQGVIDRALSEDPAAASAEWLAHFRSDLESLFSRDAVDAVVVRGRRELAPIPGLAYYAFVDPSGGSTDSMTLAIAHQDLSSVPVLDVVREIRPPFSPEAAVSSFVRELKRFNIARVTGDAYAGEWPREQFRKLGIDYAVSEFTRSELFLEVLPLVNASKVELLDDPRLLGQLMTLERRTGRSGRDNIDHRPGLHDDVANAAAGAVLLALRGTGKAVWPPEFKSCLLWNWQSRSPRCVLLGGSDVPGDPHCRRYCAGMRVAWAAYEAHQANGGTHDFRGFIEETFERKGPAVDWAWDAWRKYEVYELLGL